MDPLLQQLKELEASIDEAEAQKREFVKNNPNGAGDKSERSRLYNEVERARKALREFKLNHPEIVKLKL